MRGCTATVISPYPLQPSFPIRVKLSVRRVAIFASRPYWRIFSCSAMQGRHCGAGGGAGVAEAKRNTVRRGGTSGEAEAVDAHCAWDDGGESEEATVDTLDRSCSKI